MPVRAPRAEMVARVPTNHPVPASPAAALQASTERPVKQVSYGRMMFLHWLGSQTIPTFRDFGIDDASYLHAESMLERRHLQHFQRAILLRMRVRVLGSHLPIQ